VTRTERLVRAHDTDLYLREWGETGPPIFFWHGLGNHTSLQMIEAGPLLAAYGYRVIGVDAPGFGGSPPIEAERYEARGLVDLVSDLLDALELDRIIWSGSSWGGIVGVHFTAAHPERVAALVLIDGGYLDPINEHGETLEDLRAHWRDQDGFRFPSWTAVVEDARPWFARWSPAIEEYLKSGFREENGEVVSILTPDVFAAAIHGIDRSPPSGVHRRLGESGVPVLLLGATVPEQDDARRRRWVARFAADVPQAGVRRIDGAPHLMLEARPEETARVIGEWLRALHPRRFG
jgi:pimeloyl-ACP methyl ester carboxylesterase